MSKSLAFNFLMCVHHSQIFNLKQISTLNAKIQLFENREGQLLVYVYTCVDKYSVRNRAERLKESVRELTVGESFIVD